jgi:hypothetical protein
MLILLSRANLDRSGRFAVAQEAPFWTWVVLAAATVSGCATQSTAMKAPTSVERNTLDPATRMNANAQSVEPRAPSSPSQPPVPATARMHVLVSTISLPVDGNYPQGYSPKWSIVGGQKPVTMRFEDFVARRPLTDQALANLGLRDVNGEPTLVFSVRGLTCMATIAPAGLAVLSAQPTQFQLVNFRRMDNRPCAAASSYLRSWTGQMALSSNLAGDINLQLVLQGYSDRGQLTYRYSLTTAEPNQLTPELAAAAVQRDVRVAAEREARVKADIEARKLPAADLATFGSTAKAGSRLRVTMKAIDDIGFLVVKTPDGNWQPLATAEWSARSGPGSADVQIQDSLKIGDNFLVFGVHNKLFTLGVGGWGFNVTVASDTQVLWTKSYAEQGGGVGIRYWKAFVVNKTSSGALTFRPATDAQTKTLVPKMEEMNAWLQKDYGTENSVAGLAIEAMLQGLRSSEPQECRDPIIGRDHLGRRQVFGCNDPRRGFF